MSHKMIWSLRGLWLLVFCVPNIAAASRGIVDGGEFFGDAEQSAVATIDELFVKHHREIRIETFAAVPADQQAKLKQIGTEAFFKSWLVERAKAEQVDGIFILICRQPGMIKVGINEATRKTKFNETDREALWKLIKRRFDQKNFDAGLTDGLKYISDRFDVHGGATVARAAQRENGNHGSATFSVPDAAATHDHKQTDPHAARNHGPAPIPRANHGGGVMSFVVFGFVVFIAFLVIRGLFRALTGGAGGYGGSGVPMGGGSSFGGGFLSGLFGAVAGNALYDTFFRGHSSSSWDNSASASEPTNSLDNGGSFSSGSGSSDGWSVNDGGSFGGGDAGGGGFGGGDFGSGGSDF